MLPTTLFMLSFLLLLVSLRLAPGGQVPYASANVPAAVDPPIGHPRTGYVVVDFSVPVDPGSTAMMGTALAAAQAHNDSAIVIDMNTPGGYLDDMLSIISIVQQANQSGISTYTYVPPNGLAASAGSYIAMASNGILMGPGSEIGPSTPIVEGGTALEQNHTEGAMLSLMSSLAERWGRNTTAAQAMVTGDIAYSSTQAIQYHLVDGSVDGLTQAATEFGLSGNVTSVQESTYQQFLSTLSNADLSGLLILLGTLAIVLDITHPTVVLSLAGVVAIVAGLVGIEVVGASTLGVLVVLVGAALMVLELKLGHGFAMMGGAVVGAVGLYLLYQGVPYSPSPITDITGIEVVGVGSGGVVGGLYMRWVVWPLRKRAHLTGSESMAGKAGVVSSASLSPEGEVRVEGITWHARSVSGELKKGDPVTVKGVEGLVLVVEGSTTTTTAAAPQQGSASRPNSTDLASG